MQAAGAAGAPWLRRAALGFSGLAALLLAWPLVRLPLGPAVAYNEGWNAYHASQWRDVSALYPEPAALLTNNYPPLSFVLIGALGNLAGDHLVAGRAVAMLALLWTCAVVAILVRRHGGVTAAGVAAGAWLHAAVAIYAPGYRRCGVRPGRAGADALSLRSGAGSSRRRTWASPHGRAARRR